MSTIHLLAIAFKDISKENKPLGSGFFKRDGSSLVYHPDLQGTNERFPMEIHSREVLFEATSPNGTMGFIEDKFTYEYDFNENSTIRQAPVNKDLNSSHRDKLGYRSLSL